MAKMRAVQVSRPNGAFEVVEREIPEPPKGTVRIQVKACGICHSDSFTKEGTYPGIQYPRVPGHEVAGVIDKVGADVTGWKVGDKVGVGWYGGHCTQCESCRRGDFINCANIQVSGVTYDGGYAEYMIASTQGLALIPDDLSFTEAAPLLCAGITTFNALRHSSAKGGDLVAVLGIGGLGHLAVQFAAKMGFRVVAIARGKDKAELAKKLGAKYYIDSEAQNPAQELQKLGGATLILSTITNSNAVSATLDGLKVDGKCVVVGASMDSLTVTPMQLLRGRHSVSGWPSGTSIDSQDTMCFCSHTGVRSMNQPMPLEKAQEAYDLMMSGKARFRVVLTTG